MVDTTNVDDRYDTETLEYLDPPLVDWMDEDDDRYTGVMLRPVDGRQNALAELDDRDIVAGPLASVSITAYMQADDLDGLLADGVVEAAEIIRPPVFYDDIGDVPDHALPDNY